MIILVLLFFAVVLWLAWKSGVTELLSDEVSDFAARWGLYLKHESGAWADLPERLQYRDFHRDVVETADGWMFAPTELRPIPTDGFSHADLSTRVAVLNDPQRVIAGDPENSRLYRMVADGKMPKPPAPPLSANAVAILFRWIQEGAGE